MTVRRADGTSSERGFGGTNEVTIVGRVPSEPAGRELPSGDAVVTFRVVVARPGGTRAAAAQSGTRRRVGVDTIDCAAWAARVRKAAKRVAVGDTVEVKGALRRRFWRSPAGPASRTEVEVASLRVLVRAGSAQPVSARAADA